MVDPNIERIRSHSLYRVLRSKNALKKRGVKKGDRVILYLGLSV